jgi:hypothetical protein
MKFGEIYSLGEGENVLLPDDQQLLSDQHLRDASDEQLPSR